MDNFIKIWKADHQYILQAFDRLGEAAVGSPDWRSELFEIRDRIVNHLKMEDARLYPFFRTKAKDDPRVQCIIDLFEQEMIEISKQAVAFFGKYEQSRDLDDFISDFKTVSAALQKRIWSEENVLLEEYRRIAEKA